MKQLFLVRHGEATNDRLTDGGMEWAGQIVPKKIMSVCQGGVCKIFYSPTGRTTTTAEHIKSNLQFHPALVRVEPALNPGWNLPESFKDIMGLIAKELEDVDILILVTHEPVCDHFNSWFQQYHYLTTIKKHPEFRLITLSW